MAPKVPNIRQLRFQLHHRWLSSPTTSQLLAIYMNVASVVDLEQTDCDVTTRSGNTYQSIDELTEAVEQGDEQLKVGWSGITASGNGFNFHAHCPRVHPIPLYLLAALVFYGVLGALVYSFLTCLIPYAWLRIAIIVDTALLLIAIDIRRQRPHIYVDMGCGHYGETELFRAFAKTKDEYGLDWKRLYKNWTTPGNLDELIARR